MAEVRFRFALGDTVRLGKRAPRRSSTAPVIFGPEEWTYTYIIVKRAYEETPEGSGVVYDLDVLGDARHGHEHLWDVPQRYLTPVAVQEAFDVWQQALGDDRPTIFVGESRA